MKIYFACPLFSEADREWIRSTIEQIESVQHGANLEIPYDLITQPELDRLGSNAKFEIFSRCKSHLDDADMVIACWTGRKLTTARHGKSAISTQKGHSNRRLSTSGRTSAGWESARERV